MTVKDLKEILDQYGNSTPIVLVDENQNVKPLNLDCVVLESKLNSVVIYTGNK